jgi:PAS domain S-box-containing protein
MSIAVHPPMSGCAGNSNVFGAMSVKGCRLNNFFENIMNSTLVNMSYQDLRSRAEAHLMSDLNLIKPSLDAGRELHELRINQIEIELLSEEFCRLRRKMFADRLNRQMSGTFRCGYLFLWRDGRICDAKFEGASPVQERSPSWYGRSINDYLSRNERAKFAGFLKALFEQDARLNCELVFRQLSRKNKTALKLPLYARIEAVADNQTALCLVVIEDISMRKLAEEREKASSATLALLNRTIAASHNEIFMFDAHDLKFTFANRRALENLGYTMDELNSLTPAEIHTTVSGEAMNKLIDYLSRHKQSVRKLNGVHKRRDGSLYPVEVYLQFFEHETDGSFIAIALDISSQKAVESQLKSIVESAHAIIWAVDVNLRLEFMSDQVQDILGYSASQFVGYTLDELFDRGFFHESDKADLKDGIRRAVQGERVNDLCCRAIHADGQWRWLSVNMTPSLSLEGETVQVVGVAHDINNQKLAEEALRQLNLQLDTRVQEEILKNMLKDALLQRQSRLAAMGEMIGNIAHQWRQPINSLGLVLSDLEDAALYGECDLSYMQTAVAKSKNIIQKMSSTIDDFRHFFRADKSLKVFSLKKVTDECLNLVEAAMKSNHIKIAVSCERDVEVSGYENEYSQAVMNILSNAKDAIVGSKKSEGEICIEISEDGEFGVYALTDNGGGIPPEIMPRIFEPHFTTKEHGVGIGLYMSLVSIETNMNGRIAVENVSGGARFSIYLAKAVAGEKHVGD